MGKETENQDKTTEEEELVIIEVDENDNPIGENHPNQGKEDDDEDDNEEEDDEEEESRAGHLEGEEEEEARQANETQEERRERRRAERHARNIRQRRTQTLKDKQINDLMSLNHQLVERVARLEGKQVTYDVTHLESRLREIKSGLDECKDTMARAVKAQDGEAVAEITDVQFSLREQERQVNMMLTRAKHAGKSNEGSNNTASEGTPRKQPAAPQLHPDAARQAQDWAKKHSSWYVPGSGGADSVAVTRIDNEIFAEGYDPRAQEYWDELSRRVKEELPHRFVKKKASGNGNSGDNVNANNRSNNGEKKPSGPRMASASQNGGQRPLGKNEVRVSPERKKAMQDAGYWDDPVKRNKMLRRYSEHDRQQNQA